MSTPRIAFVLMMLVLACACRDRESPPPSAPVVTPAPAPAPSASAAPPADAKGLASPKNDPATVLLARDALACKWQLQGPQGQQLPWLDDGCPAAKAWGKQNPADLDAWEATLVNMIEDPDPRVRVLASGRLWLGKPKRWTTNRDLARRVIAAIAAETVNHEGTTAMSAAIQMIDYAATGLWPEAKAVVVGSPLSRIRGSIGELGTYNASNQEIWEWVVAEAAAGRAGPGPLAAFHATHQEDVCRILGEHMAADPQEAKWARVLVSEPTGCPAQIETVLRTLETMQKTSYLKEKGHTLPGYDWAPAMEDLLKNHAATPDQKKRAVAALIVMVQDLRNHDMLRSEALQVLQRVDKASATKVAKQLVDEKGINLRNTVRRILGLP